MSTETTISDDRLQSMIEKTAKRAPWFTMKIAAGKLHSALTELQRLRREIEQMHEDAAGEDL